MRLKPLLATTLLLLLSSCRFTQPDVSDVSFDIVYKFSLTGSTSEINFVSLIPKTIEKRQEILSIHYSFPPARIYDIGENRYAEFTFLDPEEDFEVRITVEAQLFEYDLNTALKNPGAGDEKDLTKHLAEEKYLEKSDLAIAGVCQRLSRGTEIQTVENIYYYVLRNMKYGGYDEKDVGAVQSLKLKRGDCSEYADLLVTLCRAKGIPARVVEGYCIEYTNTPKHAWAEIYLKRYGWVPFDPTLEDSNPSSFNFHRLKPVHVYLSNVRNDKVLDNYHYYRYLYWGGSVKMTDSFLVRSE